MIRRATAASTLAASILTMLLFAVVGLTATSLRRAGRSPFAPADRPGADRSPERVTFVEPRRSPERRAPEPEVVRLAAPRAPDGLVPPPLPPDQAPGAAPPSPADVAGRPPADTGSAPASAAADQRADAARLERLGLLDPRARGRCASGCIDGVPIRYGQVPARGPLSGAERDSLADARALGVPSGARTKIPVTAAERDASARERAMASVARGNTTMAAHGMPGQIPPLSTMGPGEGGGSGVGGASLGAAGSAGVPLPGGGPSKARRAREAAERAASLRALASLEARARRRADSLALRRADSAARTDTPAARARPR